jgi:hypothetical protein
MGFKLNIVTKTKMSAKQMSTTLITLGQNEVFKYNNKMYVPFSAMSVVFNSKGATKKFDKDLDCLVHPTRGKLFCLPKNVEHYIKVV